jgi:hypothetical protein
MEYKRAKVKCNSFLYFGSFYKCKLSLKQGDIWDLIHDGCNFYVLERFHTTIELSTDDYNRFFYTMDD